MLHFSLEIVDVIIGYLPIQKKFLISVALQRNYIKNQCIQIIPWMNMDKASSNGKTELLEWWRNSSKSPNSLINCKWTEEAMDLASKNGHISVLQWWKDSGLKCKYSRVAMDWASENGHIAVLQWWKNSGFECTWTAEAMDYASENGHITVLQWWKESGLECIYTDYAMEFASRNEHVAVLQWWRNFFEIPTRSIEDRTRKETELRCKWSKYAMD